MAEDPFKNKAEMIATQYMVANLYASMFGERFGVNALEPCRQFSASLREHVAGWTIPGLDPALSDHLAAEMQDSIAFQLSLIEELLQAKVEVYKEQQKALQNGKEQQKALRDGKEQQNAGKAKG